MFDVYYTRSGQIVDAIPRKPGLTNRVETTLDGKFKTKQRFLGKQEAVLPPGVINITPYVILMPWTNGSAASCDRG